MTVANVASICLIWQSLFFELVLEADRPRRENGSDFSINPLVQLPSLVVVNNLNHYLCLRNSLPQQFIKFMTLAWSWVSVVGWLGRLGGYSFWIELIKVIGQDLCYYFGLFAQFLVCLFRSVLKISTSLRPTAIAIVFSIQPLIDREYLQHLLIIIQALIVRLYTQSLFYLSFIASLGFQPFLLPVQARWLSLLLLAIQIIEQKGYNLLLSYRFELLCIQGLFGLDWSLLLTIGWILSLLDLTVVELDLVLGLLALVMSQLMLVLVYLILVFGQLSSILVYLVVLVAFIWFLDFVVLKLRKVIQKTTQGPKRQFQIIGLFFLLIPSGIEM